MSGGERYPTSLYTLVPSAEGTHAETHPTVAARADFARGESERDDGSDDGRLPPGAEPVRTAGARISGGVGTRLDG